MYAVILMMVFTVPQTVLARNYIFKSGANSSEVFGKATSTDNPISVNPETQNIRRNKDAAYFPPRYGIFSGEIPTNSTSLYHDNSMPHSGLTGNPSESAYGTGTASDFNTIGGNAAPIIGSNNNTGAEYGGILPSTSMNSADIVRTLPLYYDDGSIGTLSIPKLNINVKVFEGESEANMRRGVGKFEFNSAWDGNVGIAGHNRGVPAAIGRVKDLKNGDTIVYTTKYGTRTYEVFDVKRISETDSSGLSWSAENILSIVTCVENVPSQRWYVAAREKI